LAIEYREAGMFILAIAPRFEAASIRLEHEHVGTKEWPVTEPAVARCVLNRRCSPGTIRNKENCMISRLETTMHPSA